MNEIQIPDQLSGEWQHALFLTYGVEIPLFEGALWRQLAPGCRNKVILADGQRFLAACSSYAQPGLVRHLNHLYVADGVLHQFSVHAKAILLTNETSGRLMVGSGNLGMQGMASGGELFVKYEYSSENEQSLNAFLAVRDLLNGLLENFDVGMAARQRIQVLLEQTRWLYRPWRGDDRPVRHNLQESFLDQLRQIVGEEPVEELCVLSPFYDLDAVALQTLLGALQPKKTVLLIQPDFVSLNPVIVQQVVDAYAGHVAIHPFARGGDHRYVHAKCYLVKTATRAICLHGSPNLSRVAMLRTAQHGNVELANWLEGERNAFDYLFGDLEIGPPTSNVIDLVAEARTENEEAVTAGQWYLTRGELRERQLVLYFHGTLPDVSSAELSIAAYGFPLQDAVWATDQLRLRLTDEALQLLERAVPVALRWPDNDQLGDSNPIYISHLAALNRVLEMSDEVSALPRIGSLDLDDEEIEQLLGELEAALLIDQQSIWQIAGKRIMANPVGEDDGSRISLDDIDYDQLRRHPKLQQYLNHRGAAAATTASRLQQILNSITDHFQGFVAPAAPTPPVWLEERSDGEPEPESEEEAEVREEDRQRRRRSTNKRVRLLMGNFIKRYLRGLRSRDFQEVAGSDVMAQNYIIFSHLLWRLLAKDWLDPETVLASYADSWEIFWGGNESRGYWAQLSDDVKQTVSMLLIEHHTPGMMLATTYEAEVALHRSVSQQVLHLRIRNDWRNLLTFSPFSLDEDALMDAWFYVASLYGHNPPRPLELVGKLKSLAEFDTRKLFLRSLDRRFGLPDHSCKTTKVGINRPAVGRSDTVDCLVLGPGAMMSCPIAVEILREWMRVEPHLGYYRLNTHDGGCVAYYDLKDSSGVYWIRECNDMQELTDLEPSTMPWDGELARLYSLAAELDAQSSVPVRADAYASTT